MTASNSEINQLAQSLQLAHGPSVVTAASLLLLTRTFFKIYSDRYKTDLTPLIELQAVWAEGWAHGLGIEVVAISSAIAALEQAGRTATILDRLADDLPPLQFFFSQVPRSIDNGRW
jgi:hypothetical protein